MSYRYENNDIVIDGWEQGIASSPYAGISGLKNVDLSVPGEVGVALKTTALTKPPTVSAVAFTVETTDILTVSSTTGWYNGMAVVLNTLVDGTGLATGRVYWVGDLSGNTFKLYKNPARQGSLLVNVTLAGSGTISSYTLGKPVDWTFGQGAGLSRKYFFILDDNGRAWWLDNTGGTLTDNLIYLGNDTLTGSAGRAIITFKQHLLVFRAAAVDGIGFVMETADPDSAYVDSVEGGWSYGWTTPNSIANTGKTKRSVLVGEDDILYYFNNAQTIGSISETAGDTLDLDDSTSFTNNVNALDLPVAEANANMIISELGTNLIVGGNNGKLYPWDRISSSFYFPILLPERNIQHIVSVNNGVYIFAGNRGNIYYTNGSTVELFRKIPDHITGKINPYLTINYATADRNQLYFSITATENDATAIGDMDGVWAIDFLSNSFRHILEASHGTDGEVSLIAENVLSETPAGIGLYLGWESSTSTYGIDKGSSNPYSGGETIIDSDIIPFGTNRNQRTIGHIEFKLGKPLVSGESVELQQRSNLNDSFTTIFTHSTAGDISASEDADFENVEWIQIRAILTSTNSNPSFVPLIEVRIVK